MRNPICASSLHLSRGIRPPGIGVYGPLVLTEFYVQNWGVFLRLGLRPFRGCAHHAHRLAGEHELTKLHVDLRKACKKNMITPARVNDQELAVAAELARIDDPAVARRHDLCTVTRLQYN